MLNFKFLGINGSLQELDGGNTSLLVRGEEGAVAVDVSCHLAAVTEADVDAVILTHEHIDHVYGLPSLLHQMWIGGREKPLDLYIPKGMEPLVNGQIDLFGLREKNRMFEIRIHTEEEFFIGSMCITSFSTDHTKLSRGIMVEEGKWKLAYTCDTRPIGNAPSVMSGAQVLIHEASGLSAEEETLIKKGHSSGRDAGKLAQELGVKTLYLCHLPDEEDGKEGILREAREVFPETYIPEVLKEMAVEGV